MLALCKYLRDTETKVLGSKTLVLVSRIFPKHRLFPCHYFFIDSRLHGRLDFINCLQTSLGALDTLLPRCLDAEDAKESFRDVIVVLEDKSSHNS